MAKGVDELVNHVLSEIALTGVRGMHDSRLLFCFCVLSLSKSDWFACSSRNNSAAATRVGLGGRCSQVHQTPLSPHLVFESHTVHYFVSHKAALTDRPQELAVPTLSVSYSPFMKSSRVKMDPARAFDLNSWVPNCMRGFGTG